MRMHGWTRLRYTLSAPPPPDPTTTTRAENCGALQLQFVDQVELSLFGNRHIRTVQLCSRQLPKVVSSGQLRRSFWGPAHRCRARGACPQKHGHPELGASTMA